MRTIVDLPTDQIEQLDTIREREHASRAKLIRQAIVEFLERRSEELAKGAFGIWRDHPVDAVKWQNSLRDEWQR